MGDISIIKKYFPQLSADQEEKFEALYPLYQEWNEKINVISRKDIDELYLRHVLHSLAIARFIGFKEGSKIMDLGTGGGFPGVPLAIMFPGVEFLLTDSISKKIKVVQEVGKSLNLANMQAIASRAESVEGKFDFIVTRAVARSAKLYNWCKTKISKTNSHTLKNGIIALKGGDLTEELSELKKRHTVVPISQFFEEDFFETKKVVHF